jgi:hypothetical protein
MMFAVVGQILYCAGQQKAGVKFAVGIPPNQEGESREKFVGLF